MQSVGYGGEQLRWQTLFVQRRRTLSIEVHPDQRVVVRAPVGCPPTLIAERVRRRAPWICRQIADFGRYTPRTTPRRYVSGESHRYLGRDYRLRIVSGPRPSVRLDGARIVVTLDCAPSPARARKALQTWYRSRAREVFAQVLSARLATIRGTPAPRLVIRTLRSRWGSLSKARTMTLNVALIQRPRACIEYVIVHELCHLTHHHHGTAFYRLLRRVMPDWKRRKLRLELAGF